MIYAFSNQSFDPLPEAGVKYSIRFSFDIPGAGLYVQGPDYNDGLTTLQSEYAEAIDYYYVYGPAVDDIIAGYRELFGQTYRACD